MSIVRMRTRSVLLALCGAAGATVTLLPSAASACDPVTMCVEWELQLEDGEWGDYLTGPTVRARGTRVTIIRPAPEPPLGLFLDEDGCITFDTQYAAGHKVIVYNEAVIDDFVHVKVFEGEQEKDDDETHFWIVDVPPIGDGEMIEIPVSVSTDNGGITNMMGTATETLHRLDTLSGDGLPNQARSMRVWYDHDNRNANGGIVEIRLGRDSKAEKFILGHEIGHWVEQGIANDVYFPDYTYPVTDEDCEFAIFVDPDDPDALPPGQSNSHGIRSAERSGGAMTEGFAHFIASAAYNDPVNPGGEFRYYKEIATPGMDHPYQGFVDGENLVALEGGAAAGTLGGQNRWVATMCPTDWNAAGAGNAEISSEIDWLRFWWAFYTADNPGTPPDFWEVIDLVAFTHVNHFWDDDAVWYQLVAAIEDPVLGLDQSARFTGLEPTYDVVND